MSDTNNNSKPSNHANHDDISHNSSNATEETDFTLAYCPICQTTGRKDHMCSKCENADITYNIPVEAYKPPNSETHEDEDFDIETQNDSDNNDQDVEINSQNHDDIEDILYYNTTEANKSSQASQESMNQDNQDQI